MDALVAFAIAFIFSFVGTIPPGTLNLSVVQMGLEHRVQQAWRFSLAASVIEYFYAWLAVEFESLITSSTAITDNFQLLSGIVMLLLGAISLISVRKPSKAISKLNQSGFRKGFVLGLLNPMALPFWVAMTAYIKSQKWLDIDTTTELHAYLFGVALGGFALMMVMFAAARQAVKYFEGNTFIQNIPGITLVALGIYALVNYAI